MRSESTTLLTVDDVEWLRQAIGQLRGRFLTWRRRRLGLRGGLLYVAASPLFLAALLALATGNLQNAAVCSAGFFAVLVAARLNRRGILEKMLAPERRYTRTARVPHQFLALALLAGAVFSVAHIVIGHAVLTSVLYVALAVTGFALAYRPGVPFSSADTAVRVSDPALLRALRQAEKKLLSIEVAALNVGNPELETRLRRIVERGRTVLSMLAERPSELFRSRQFLAVHLDGAERVAARYVKTHRLARAEKLEESFRVVLGQIEKAIDRQRKQMLQQDAFDLDVQIEVLRKQLAQHDIR